MAKLWLLRGDLDAPGWDDLRRDFKAEKVDIVHLDPMVWALLEGEEPPQGYAGLEAVRPEDGLYVDPNGSPLYLVGAEIVPGPREVVAALGARAESLLDKVGDPDTVLERLGRVF